VLVTGDQLAIECAKQELNDFVGVIVKEAVGRYAAKIYPFEIVKEKLRTGVEEAMHRLREFKPTIEREPVEVKLTFYSSAFAETASLLPNIERLDARTIRYTANSYLEAYRLLRVCLSLSSLVK
jgi:D-amino peptidase